MRIAPMTIEEAEPIARRAVADMCAVSFEVTRGLLAEIDRLRAAPLATVEKRYDELVPGDRIVLSRRGLIRTVASAGPNGTVNRLNKPLWTVLYSEGSTDEWSGGNSGLPSSTAQVIV